MAQTITAKYSVGDTAYYTIFAVANIYACKVDSIYLRDNTLYYTLIRIDKNFKIPDVPEKEVLSFAEAKNSLVTYLNSKLLQVNSLTA